MKKKVDKKEKQEVGLAGKPVLMKFDEYVARRLHEEGDDFQFAHESLRDIYDRYMPMIMKRVKSQGDLKQLSAMVQRDIAQHPIATQGTVSGLSNRRVKDLDQYAGMGGSEPEPEV